MFTLTLAQHIIRRADVHGTQSVAGRVIGMSDSMYRKWMQAVAKTLQTATEKVNMAIYEIARLPAMLLMKRCTSTPVEAVFLHPAEVPQYGVAIPGRVDARRFVGR